MAHSLQLVSTRGFYGTATDRIVAISTRGFYDELVEVALTRVLFKGLGPKYLLFSHDIKYKLESKEVKYGFTGKDAKHKFKDKESKYKFGTHEIG